MITHVRTFVRRPPGIPGGRCGSGAIRIRTYVRTYHMTALSPESRVHTGVPVRTYFRSWPTLDVQAGQRGSACVCTQGYPYPLSCGLCRCWLRMRRSTSTTTSMLPSLATRTTRSARSRRLRTVRRLPRARSAAPFCLWTRGAVHLLHSGGEHGEGQEAQATVRQGDSS